MNIFLIGDIMLGRLYNKKIGVKRIWGDSMNFLNSDLVVGNLEMTATDSELKYPNKVFNYKLKTALGYSHFKPLFNKTIFNTANNHILDFNLKGMNDTFDFIKNIGCQQVGSGKTKSEAKKYKIFISRGKKVMVFGAADHYDYWEVGKKKTQVKGNEGIWYIDLKIIKYKNV